VLGSSVHGWGAEEQTRYPGSWTQGVAFESAEVWEEPVPLQVVWRQLSAATTNPNANFQAGVTRVKQEDYERILNANAIGMASESDTGVIVQASESDTGMPVQAPKAPHASVAHQPAPSGTAGFPDRLFTACQVLRQAMASSRSLSEDATRARLINRYLDALGYTELDDVEYGHQTTAGDFADYVLRANGENVLALEAKRLGEPLTAKHAAQVVKYAAVLNVRWGVVTNGQVVKVYDARMPVAVDRKLVFDVDLANYTDREDFDVNIVPTMALLEKTHMPADLEARAAQQAIRSILTDKDGPTVARLTQELQERTFVQMTTEEVASIVGDLLG